MVHTAVLVAADSTHPRHSEASLLELDDGSWLLAWSAFSAVDVAPGTDSVDAHAREWAHSRDNNPAEIRAMRSTDAGRSWSDSVTLVADDAGINVMQPALLRLLDGRIGLSYSHRESADRASRLFVTSGDVGETWSAPVDVTGRDGYVTAAHDRLLRLSGGRIVQPCHSLVEGHAHTLVARSDDDGATWAVSDPIELARRVPGHLAGIWEASIAELDGGELLLCARTALGSVFASRSTDGGESWSPPTSTGVTAPSAPCLVRRRRGGALVLVHNPGYRPGATMLGERTPLVASSSSDGGHSWMMTSVLEDDPASWFHYVAATEVEGGLALVYSVTDPASRLWSLVARIPA